MMTILTLTVLGYFAPGPPSDLSPEGADRRKIWHAPQKLCKEKDLGVIFPQNYFINYDNLCKLYA